MKADDIKSETDVSSFSSTRNNNSRTQIQKLILIVSITALVIFGFFIAVPSTIITAQLPPPSSSPSSNTTKTAASTALNATATTAKPVRRRPITASKWAIRCWFLAPAPTSAQPGWTGGSPTFHRRKKSDRLQAKHSRPLTLGKLPQSRTGKTEQLATISNYQSTIRSEVWFFEERTKLIA